MLLTVTMSNSCQVAAGMSVKFDVCMKAPDVAEIGHVSLDIAIVMETEVFQLPILATVLPTQVYCSFTPLCH